MTCHVCGESLIDPDKYEPYVVLLLAPYRELDGEWVRVHDKCLRQRLLPSKEVGGGDEYAE